MTESQVQASVLSRYGLRIEEPMARVAIQKMTGKGEIAVIGVDARTGVPRRQIIQRDALLETVPLQ